MITLDSPSDLVDYKVDYVLVNTHTRCVITTSLLKPSIVNVINGMKSFQSMNLRWIPGDDILIGYHSVDDLVSAGRRELPPADR